MNGSPKTPGGISKSLLTPCRRVGLSRTWRKSGCSQFISPLNTHNATPERTGSTKEKKRKKCEQNEDMDESSEAAKEKSDSLDGTKEYSSRSCIHSNVNNDITSTPCRNNQIPRKKSKVLSLSLKNNQGTEKDELANNKKIQSNKLFNVDDSKVKETEDNSVATKNDNELKVTQAVIEEFKAITSTPEENVSKLNKTESKNKKLSLKKSLSKSELRVEKTKPKENSPNNLTKECIVVIQNKMVENNPNVRGIEIAKASQGSDTELDVPLGALKTKSIENVTLNTLNDDDFITKPKKKIRNLSTIKRNKTSPNPSDTSSTSQSSQEDMDKRTILVKNTYDKVIKPQKAKSTGSITQKDIDDLKARIEMKKKLLLAKSMSIDTVELRGLIKKWQRGCQDALLELLDLMKTKLPDRQNMDYAEILKTLKIPAELVGYDSENDCFISPNDTNVLLSAFKL